MNPKLTKRCKSTDKIQMSEAAAVRALRKVPGARRYYLCDSCGDFHITSLGRGLMKQLGRDAWSRSSGDTISQEDINKRIKELS